MILIKKWNIGSFLLVLLMAVIILNFAFAQTAYASVFDGKYSKSQVFDCQRSPIYPIAGAPFTAWYFANIYDDVNGGQFDPSIWGTNGDRYIQLTGASIAMNLYEADGTFVRVISPAGTVYGLGEEGYLYISDARDYGYFISNKEGYAYGDSVTYTPYTSEATPEELDDYDATTTPLGEGETASSPDVSPSTITFTNPTRTSIVMNWSKATDDVSAQGDLEYLAYSSLSDNIGTIIDAESNGTAVGTYAKDINSALVSGITLNTTYYYNVIVQDEAGNKMAYTSASYTVNQYTITYNLDGGINSGSNPADYLTGETPITLGAATKASHTFGGWYEEAELVNEVTEIANESAGDIALWAMWEKIIEDPQTGDNSILGWIALFTALALGCAAIWLILSRKRDESDQ